MYEIRPESIKTFIEDRTIKLPRFQRKQTWDEKKNFALAISLFKGFPLGVVVINKEKVGRSHVKWLLDGRQRRNAFITMLSDPESLYIWGRKFIGIKAGDQPADIEEAFWKRIEEELGKEDGENMDQGSQDEQRNEVEPETTEDDAENEDNSENEPQVEAREQFRDLDLLLEIIVLTHSKTRRYSGITRPFDFEQFTSSRLSYVENIQGEKHLNARRLKTWINEYKADCLDNDRDYKNVDVCYEYLKNRYVMTDDNKNRLKTKLGRNWNKILKIFSMLDVIESKLQEAKIGLIELNQADASDAQNTFRIINTAGTPLNAPEIMSAKPSWNIKIPSPSATLQDEVKTLYRSIGTEQDDVVKWDIPATLMNRLDQVDFIFKELSYDRKDFAKKITFGFQTLSAIYEKGISKLHIDKLSGDDQINWTTAIDLLVSDLNSMGRILKGASFFNYLKSWKTDIMDLTQDAIAINFLIISYMDWVRKGKPIGSSGQTPIFIKNAMINFDGLIYEYITRQWRGPGDMKIADNIKNFGSVPALFVATPKEKWEQLINEIITSHTIASAPLSKNSVDQYLKPILYYSYILQEISGPMGSDTSIEIDHIIPTTLLDASTIPNKEIKTHNLFNLALLPKRQNISKSNKRLNEVNDHWLQGQIATYTGISTAEFARYSNITNLDALRDLRKSKYLGAFKQLRDRMFHN